MEKVDDPIGLGIGPEQLYKLKEAIVYKSNLQIGKAVLYEDAQLLMAIDGLRIVLEEYGIEAPFEIMPEVLS